MHFEDFILKTRGGCWIWKGCCYDDGQPLYLARGKGRKARTVAFERHTKRPLDGARLSPKCNHPLCIRPEHQKVL